jgi:hypothetical protein
MGPVIGVPNEVAQRIKDDTDLVEVDEVLPDLVDEYDVQLGGTPEDVLLLVETPKDGFGRLVSFITEFAKSAPRPFELIVSDQHGNPHAFPGHLDVNGRSIMDHLKLAYFGEPGDRRPLLGDYKTPLS